MGTRILHWGAVLAAMPWCTRVRIQPRRIPPPTERTACPVGSTPVPEADLTRSRLLFSMCAWETSRPDCPIPADSQARRHASTQWPSMRFLFPAQFLISAIARTGHCWRCTMTALKLIWETSHARSNAESFFVSQWHALTIQKSVPDSCLLRLSWQKRAFWK